MIDLSSKKYFFFDLDDTLVDTYSANELGFKKAYQRLTRDSGEDISSKLPYEVFKSELKKTYDSAKNASGKKKYYDFEAEVFEEFCKKLPLTFQINPGCSGDSLSARLFLHFRQTKNSVLMPVDHALDLLSLLRNNSCSLFCITRGRCNYQHTKLLLTNLDESLFDSLIVVSDENDSKGDKLIAEIEKKHLPLKHTVMVGDNVDDIVAGHTAKIDAVRIKYGSHKDDDPKDDLGIADLELNNLGELLERCKKGGFK